jgi:hypothetical protein
MQIGTEKAVASSAVKRSIVLLAISVFVLGPLKTVMDWSYLRSLGGSVSVLLFTGALNAFLLWKMYGGRNWARITFLVLFCLGFLPWLFVITREFHRSLALWSISMIQTAIQIYAALLQFTTPGSEWFRTEKMHP